MPTVSDICPGNICPGNICPATFVLATYVHIMNISAVTGLFWPNFKGRLLGPSVNCQDDICPGNTCPSNICPYQEYLSCHWPNFDQTLKVGSSDHLEQISTVSMIFVKSTFVLTTFVHIRNISAVTDQTLKVGFWTQCFAVLNFNQLFLTKILFDPNFFGPKLFWTKIGLKRTFLSIQNL